MMKTGLVLVVALAIVAVSASLQDLVVQQDMIDFVNAPETGSTWKAGVNEYFKGKTIQQVKRMLNTHLRKRGESHLPTAPIVENVGAIPASFDARTQWPGCIHPIRDQGQCGSCWAFGASEVLSDRMCIASKGNISVVLSPEDLVSCDTTDFGCEGGYLDNAWNYMKNTGIVADSCMPYVAGGGVASRCPSGNQCPGTGPWKKYHASSVVNLPDNVATIQTEIMTNGPVEAAFYVYQDFMNYKSGVYTHVTGSFLGGHAVKAVGWGVTSAGVPYWIVANSWNTNWGDLGGFFWIKRGNNECEFESNMVVGAAKVSENHDSEPEHFAAMAELEPAESVRPEPHWALDSAPAIDLDTIERINSNPTSTWKAGINAKFYGWTVGDARRLLGTHLDHPEDRKIVRLTPNAPIPASFDARTAWPKCVGAVRDQGQCGSCWAVSASEVLSDRFCVATNSSTIVVLGAEELVACDTTDYGCEGGYLQNAWQFMASNGIPTEQCFPYSSGDGSTPPCPSTCTDGSAMKLYYAQASTIQTLTDMASMQTALMTTGPIQASFSVYNDFFGYKSGVYKWDGVSGLAGGHAIKIVGWGTLQGTPYWLVYNSWGTSWGMSGTFMILRGQNECDIESNAVIGLPKTK